jgi:cytochrome oxidase assembly protein ShyY1
MNPVPLSKVFSNLSAHEWQQVTEEGTFDSGSQILLRNRYSEGVYGFELLTLFTSTTGRKFWVDCGWVKAGKDAATKPALPKLPDASVKITGRLRIDTSLPHGPIVIDLLSGSENSLTPSVPAQLPELSDGPHMAYALQWLFFGGLIIYGRLLIRRDVLSGKEL